MINHNRDKITFEDIKLLAESFYNFLNLKVREEVKSYCCIFLSANNQKNCRFKLKLYDKTKYNLGAKNKLVYHNKNELFRLK